MKQEKTTATKGFKISSKNKELLTKKGVTIAELEEQAKNNTPATITSGSGTNKRVTEVADSADAIHEFKNDDERQEYMRSLAEQKKYYVGVRQKRYHKTLLTLGFKLPTRKVKSKEAVKEVTVKPDAGSSKSPKAPNKKRSFFKRKPKAPKPGKKKAEPIEKDVKLVKESSKSVKEKARKEMEKATKQNSKSSSHHKRNLAMIGIGLLLALSAAYYAVDANLVETTITLPYEFIN